MLTLPGELRGASGKIEQHDGLPQRTHRLQQPLLGCRQREVAARRTLAAHPGRFAQSHHHYVGLARQRQRFFERFFVVHHGDGNQAVSARHFTLCAVVVEHVAALTRDHAHLALEPTLESLAQSFVFRRILTEGPRAGHIAARVGQRSDQRQRPFSFQRQQTAFVPEQHETLGRDAAADVAVLAAVHLPFDAGGISVAVGVLEEAEPPFGLQHAPAGPVDPGHQAVRKADEQLRAHIHIRAGFEGALRILRCRPDAVTLHLADAGVVAHHKAFEVPLAAQHLVEQPAVGGRGHAVHDVERRHHAAGAFFHGGFVGREILVVHPQSAHIHRVVVASALGGAVECEVFHTGQDGVRALLIAAHHGACHEGAQIGVFTGAFGLSAPAGIQGDVHHRREGPGHTAGRSFRRSDARRLLNGFQVPRGGHAERDGEDGLVAVDDVHAHQQGDAQTRLLHRHALHFDDFLCALDVEKRARFALADEARGLCAQRRARLHVAHGELVHLSEFLFERHPGHQAVNERVHRLCAHRRREAEHHADQCVFHRCCVYFLVILLGRLSG